MRLISDCPSGSLHHSSGKTTFFVSRQRRFIFRSVCDYKGSAEELWQHRLLLSAHVEAVTAARLRGKLL